MFDIVLKFTHYQGIVRKFLIMRKIPSISMIMK